MKRLNVKSFFLILGLFLTAVPIFSKAQTTDRLGAAAKLMNEGKLNDARALVNEEISANPNSADGYYHLGYCYYLEQKVTEALPQFEKSWKLFESSGVGNTGVGCLSMLYQCYRIQKDYAKSLFYAKLKAKRFPQYKLANLSTLADGYRALQQYDSSIYFLKEALKLEAREWFTYYQLGHCYSAKGNYDMAMYYFDRSIEVGINPANEPIGDKLLAFPYVRKGDIQLAQGFPQAAKVSYEMGIQRFNQTGIQTGEGEAFALACTNLAIVKETLLDYEGSLASLKMAEQFDPSNESIPVVAVRVQKKMSERDKLRNDPATKLGCFDGDCQNGVGSYRFQSGDVFKGQFMDGVKQGNGVLKFATGDSYVGTFIDDKLGNGAYRKSDGSLVQIVAGQQVVKPEFQVNQEDREAVKKARKKGFWSVLSDIAVGAAVVTLAVMEEEEKADQRQAAAEAKQRTQPAGSPATSGSATGGQCFYCFWYQLRGDEINISPIYQLSSSGSPRTDVLGTQTDNNQYIAAPHTDANGNVLYLGGGPQVANPDYGKSYSVKIGSRLCKSDFRIVESERSSKMDQYYLNKTLSAEKVRGCN